MPRDSRNSNLNKLIARNIRELRKLSGITQSQLAETIGVTYQQAYKYEAGINRISAARLWQIADALGAPITHFYSDRFSNAISTSLSREVLELNKQYTKIPNRKHRDSLREMARSLVEVA